MNDIRIRLVKIFVSPLGWMMAQEQEISGSEGLSFYSKLCTLYSAATQWDENKPWIKQKYNTGCTDYQDCCNKTDPTKRLAIIIHNILPSALTAAAMAVSGPERNGKYK